MSLINRIKYYTPDQLEEIHQASVKILEETGIALHLDAACDVFKKHGAKVEGQTVRISRKMIDDCLSTCPETFRHVAMDRKKSITVGDPEQPLWGYHYGPAHILESDGKKRLATLSDSIKGIKLYQSSNVINIGGMHYCEPTDISQFDRHLLLGYYNLKHFDKPFLSYNMLSTSKTAHELLDLFELAYGGAEHDGAVFAGLSIVSASPLRYERASLEPAMAYASRGQAIWTGPCPISGVSSPFDPTGTLVLLNAETLALICLVQLINPGNPVVYGAHPMLSSLKTMNTAWGSPEAALMDAAAVQLAIDRYHLPTRVPAGITNASRVDYLACMETMQSAMLSALSGAHMMYYMCGVLEDVLTVSFEKFIFDEEIVCRVKRIREGMAFSKEALSVEDIQKVGIGGSYLTHPNTRKNCHTGWTPIFSDWDKRRDPNEDIIQVAKARVEQRVAAQPESLIDDALDKELKVFVNKYSTTSLT